ncbi:hypothetical protein WDW37_10900 [Bdellovibrionota bacterium FG-1]
MNYTKTIIKIINKQRVVNIQTLRASLNGRSRCSVFRDLSAIMHLSSFTHAGRYFTLPNIPSFDAEGLWFSGEIGFSSCGTLKDAVHRIVSESNSGYTHEELKSLFRVRVHNVLLDLVHLKRIGREPLSEGKSYLYIHADEQLGRKQRERRRSADQQVSAIENSIMPLLVIYVLAEVIRDRALQVSAKEIQDRLAQQGVISTIEQVNYVFGRYGISVKKTPRSR